MKLRMPYTVVLVLLALLGGFSGAAPADTVAHFDFHSPSGFIPPSPYVTATGSGRFSFPTALVSNLAEGSAITVHRGDLTSFSLTVTAAYQGAESTFVFTLPSISSFSEVAAKNGPGFYGERIQHHDNTSDGDQPCFWNSDAVWNF